MNDKKAVGLGIILLLNQETSKSLLIKRT